MAGIFDKLFTRRTVLAGGAAAGAAATAAGGLAGCGKKAPTKLAIIHTNDSHGFDLLSEDSMGLAAAAQLRSDYEAEGYEVLMFDAGDAVQGENLVNVSQGDNGIDFMNVVGCQAMALGNHEFDYGQDKITDFVAAAEFPILSANVFVDATGDTLVEPRTTLTLANGTKVGVFGLTTPETYTKVSPLLVKGLTFLEGDELYVCAQEQADALRADGCELVVCLAHLGEDDASAPNRAMDVAANTSGIDLIIDGHDHKQESQTLANAKGEDVLVVEAECYTHAVGVVTWEDGKLASTLVTFGSYEGQDAAVAAHIEEVADEVYAELGEIVATSGYVLDGEREPGIRTRETNLGDLVTDAILWEAQQMADDTPDCAMINGGAIRMTLMDGDITTGDVVNALPFINYVCTIQATGAQILEAIEAACAATPDEMGAFPQVSGLRFTVDTRVAFEPGEAYPGSTYNAPAKPGARVTIHDVGGRGFDLDETYTIAATDFICAGGDTYYTFAEVASKTMKTINYVVYDCVVYYLQEACGGEVPKEYADAAGQGRIEVIV